MAIGNRHLTRRQALILTGSALAGARWSRSLAADSGTAAGAAAAGPWSSDKPSLSGAFAPVFDERDDFNLVVDGEIPKGLRGVFMRNGPNPLFEPDAHYSYPFDGTGMVHALYLENGKASYRNRWVVTREFAEERAAGHRIYNSSFSAPPHADLANTNIVQHADRLLALFEGGLPYAMNVRLETTGLVDYDGQLPGRMSAHPKIDPVTGELLSVAYDLKARTMTYLRMSRHGRIDRQVTFQPPWAAMVHDIAITTRHVVAFICPLVFDYSKGGPPATWQPEKGTAVALIPRDAKSGTEVVWIEAAPFFTFHTVNAHAEGGRIEVVVPWYDSYSLTERSKRLELHRLVIDLEKKTLSDQPLDDRVCEFGRVNDQFLGKKARYGYVGLRSTPAGQAPQMGAFEAFARYDLKSGSKEIHQFPAGQTICEPVFVADPHGKHEEDGFILSFVHDAANAAGLFVILDARHLSAAPLATVRLPRRVPAGLHGSWIPASA
jgi:carotenoid cleavage dioxygenase-like enzyme